MKHPNLLRAATSGGSWIAAGLAVVVILVGTERATAQDDLDLFVRLFVQAGTMLVLLAAVGLAAGVVGLLLELRPVRPTLLVPLGGMAANGLLLWSFAPSILCLYF